MNAKCHSDADIRALLDEFEHPMLAVRAGKICAANDGFAGVLGLPRENIVGRNYLELLPPEERQRMAQISTLRQSGRLTSPGHLWAVAINPDGRRRPLEVHTQSLRSLEADDYTVVSLFPQPEQQLDTDFTELLVATSAAVVAERTLSGVEQAALACLERGGLSASVYVSRGSGFVHSSGGPELPPSRVEHARAALAEGRPIFDAGPKRISTHVVLPLSGQGFEPRVLVISGSSVDTRLGSVFSLFSRVLSAALSNAAKHDDSMRRLDESRLLLELAHITSGTLEMSSVLNVAADFLIKLLDVSLCHILLYEPKTRMLRSAAGSSAHREALKSIDISIDDERSIAARVARERRSVTVGPERIRREGLQELVERFGNQALVGLPLLTRDELLGVVILTEQRTGRQFSPTWVELAEATVGQLALSIANARLYDSLRNSYAELAQTRAEMVRRERLAALGELSAVVAHEVRNPLAVIFNAVSSLGRVVAPTGDARQLLAILGEESDRLNRMVSDLLDFARPRDLRFEPEDLAGVIQESLDAAAMFPSEEGRHVTFDAHVEPGLPPVRLDRRLMQQALVNVAVNAIQAMPRGGTVRVRASRERVGDREEVRIELSDDGPGIPKDIEGRIFEPFFTTKAQGTGLGLAVVKRIVDEHQGALEVHSESGRGTTFTFRLPVGRDSATSGL
jgi:two-component system, NtrC family, sensor histidine kinase HydH